MKGGKPGLFELANEGTLFLDEIGEMSVHLQAKLLRTLQDRRVRRVGSSREIAINVRIISATNRDLEKQVACGLFREDLYYRLNVIPLFFTAAAGAAGRYSVIGRIFFKTLCRQTAAAGTGLYPGGAGTSAVLRLAGQCARIGKCSGTGRQLGGRNGSRRTAHFIGTPASVAPNSSTGRPF
ncbi:Anaerobic nitric oxide reductase transcription regulator NorR [Sporomusa acidovorans DSM 3132]|uniref:Anaerobic nitric oxide reductase transcription regulator NorR n=1 Tax=Sporomusa acidovorans (strain ATCC 49682 / DSM 3132 / Mol) TaxID=1123286 RepID=A0ABZ3J959_SPOA4